MENELLFNKMENKNVKGLRAVVIGATGSVGRDLVDILLGSDKYSLVVVPVRRTIDRWENLSKEKSDKLKIIKIEDLNILNEDKSKIQRVFDLDLQNFSSVFCCLGSRVNQGEEMFTRVDYTYVMYSASLCKKFNIPHFSLVSSAGTNSSSWFLYLRVKGRVEDDLKKLDISNLSIFKPGFIADRDNDSRCGEGFAKYFCCCFPNISSRNLALGLYNESISINNKSNNDVGLSRTYENSNIVELSRLNL